MPHHQKAFRVQGSREHLSDGSVFNGSDHISINHKPSRADNPGRMEDNMTMTVYYKMSVEKSFTKVERTGKAEDLKKWKKRYEEDFISGFLVALRVEYDDMEEEE